MYTYIIFALSICGGLTSPQNGYDLKLDQVFRTPKDFSKVNFDHFEILERNNFDSTPSPPTTTKTDVLNTIDHPPKSVANAQVMLRFGGDDIRNCQGFPVSSRMKEIEKPCCESREVRPVCPKPLSIVGTPTIYPYNEYRYPAYPAYYPTALTSQCAYGYPPPPYDFPGYYYGVRPIPAYLSNPYAMYNGQFVPSEEVVVTEPCDPCEKPRCPCEPVCEKETFLECSTALKPPPCASRPKILATEILSDEKILDVNIPDIQSTPNLFVKDKIYLTKQGNRVIEEIIEAAPERVIKINNIDCSCIDPNPCSHKPSCVEECDKECLCTPKQNIQTLLDQALVPLTCQKCQEKRRLLVSYPIAPCGEKLVTIPEEEIIVPKCTCCEKCCCDSCNRERNCNIPYGKRFSADLDCLLKVVPPTGCCGTRCIPPALYRTSPCDIPSKIYPTIRDPCCPTPVDCCDEPCAKVEVITPCQPLCETPCQTPCQRPCQPLCQTPCLTPCETPCETPCQRPCQPLCETPCLTPCETPCQRPCQPLCQKPCLTPCETPCETPCQRPCKPLCETSCLTPCETTCQRPLQPLCQTPCLTPCETPCQRLCQPLCQTPCLTPCETPCETPCQRLCQPLCQTSCLTPCETPCQRPCQPLCETSCLTPCDTPCQRPCQPLCQTSCLTPCQRPCQPLCETPCLTPCDTPCQRPCQPLCQTSCLTPCDTPCQRPCQSLCQTPCQRPCEPLCQTPCLTPCGTRAVELVAPCGNPPRILNQIVSVPPNAAPSVINQVLSVPPLLYGGCKTLSESFFSSLPYSERSKLIVDGLTTSTGAEIYSDPLKSIIYKEPTITNVVNVKNPMVPVCEQTKIVEPHLYKVFPKYDVLGDEIGPLNIPDLVPTNRYLCAKCNNLLPPRACCSREYLPIERRVPLIREVPSYVPSCFRDLPLIREAPIYENYVSRRYCPTCAKYTGELNE